MTYILGDRSRRNLTGVDPRLIAVVEKAITITTVDFSVVEGLRTKARQTALVAAGASKTLNSRHLTGHAVDIAPYIAGRIRWETEAFYPVAYAMWLACRMLETPIRWGCVWDRELQGLAGVMLRSEVKDYCARHAGADFLDFAHFELPWRLNDE
jgi:peptidoglycan L-alanyl-D-glutamate endopeptidase CwlK